MPIRVVLFDLGGVVCRFRPERRLSALAQASGLPGEEILARIWTSGLEAMAERGAFSAGELRSEISSRLGVAFDLDALARLWSLAFEPDPVALSVVDTVRSAARTGLLTDNGPILRHAMPRLFPEVERRFEWLLFSCELGTTKPAPELYDRVVARVGHPAHDVVLIDDSPANVAGARARGLHACLYTGVEALRHELAALSLPA